MYGTSAAAAYPRRALLESHATMALSKEDNELLTRVGPETPMGALFRRFWTPLLLAIHWRNRAAAAVLIEAGADVDRRNRSGATPLFLAAGYGMDGVVRLLLEHGADPRAEVRGANALWAAAGGSAIRNPAEGPPLGHCFPEVLDALLTAAPDLKLGGRLRSRVLHWLANDHCETVVADLLAADFSLR